MTRPCSHSLARCARTDRLAASGADPRNQHWSIDPLWSYRGET